MKTRIVALTGAAGSGKSTVAHMLLASRGGKEIGLADPFKKFCAEVFDFSPEQLWGPSDERNKEDLRYPRGSGYLTPRYALQTLGSEWGRNCYEDIWIDIALREARKYLSKNSGYVVIPDVRFLNEVKALKAAGAVVWQIHRPGNDNEASRAGVKDHPSEKEQEDPVFNELVDVRISNKGSTDLLRAIVLARLRELEAT